MNAFFVALLAGEERGRRLAAAVAEALGPAAARLRLPRPEGLHLTLLYLGASAPRRTAALAEALAPRLARLAAPRLVVRHAGAFPRRGAERVLWLGVEEELESEGRLAALHEAVLQAAEEASHTAGVRPIDTRAERARPFRPHLSVARPRAGAACADLEAFFGLALDERWSPAAAHLVESVPGEGPRHYAPRQAFPLAPG